jgi:DNA-binding response OmpR family regulator
MKKILIVEDQDDIREFILITLELSDHELHTAVDGLQGWQMAQEIKPDLVLSDVMMPGMDGLELCTRIKGEPGLRQTCVVLLSARGQAADRQAGANAGADAYLAKPYGPRDLLATVDQLIG